jgi:hypothetical protein
MQSLCNLKPNGHAASWQRKHKDWLPICKLTQPRAQHSASRDSIRENHPAPFRGWNGRSRKASQLRRNNNPPDGNSLRPAIPYRTL